MRLEEFLAAPRRPVPAPDGRDVILAFVLYAVLLGAAAGGIFLLNPPGRRPLDSAAAKLALTAAILVWQNAIILAAAALISWRHRVNPGRLLSFAPISWRVGLFSILAGAGMGIGLGLGVQLIQHLLHLPPRTPGVELLDPAGFSWTAFATIFLLGALLAPFAEEILFRGILYGWLRRRMRVRHAALLSAIPFGLLHVEPLHILYATAAGFLLALLFQRSGSLWSAVLAHVAINSIAIVSVYLALAEGVPISHI